MTLPSDSGWINIPSDLRPSRVPKARYSEFAGLQIKEMLDGTWSVKTKENYSKLAKPKIRLTLLARGSQFEPLGIERLHKLLPITDSTPPDQLEQFSEAKKRQASLRDEQEPLWSRFVGELVITQDKDLENKLRDFQSEGQNSDSLWLAEPDDLFSRRLTFMRMLFAQKYTREAVDAVDFAGFPAAQALMKYSSAGFTMFFSPMFLMDSPWVRGNSVMRPNATIIKIFEVPEPGRDIGWTDQLDSFKLDYAGRALLMESKKPNTNLETREVVLGWWTSSLSELLWVVTDPTRFTDNEGNYEPAVQLGVTLTIERMFVTAIEIMCHKTKDELLRKTLLFDLLDLLEGQGFGDYKKNLSYEKQYKLWSELKISLPTQVVEVFSPVIEDAFNALLDLDSGFWSSVNRTTGNQLLIQRKDGTGRDSISIDRARGEYLRILRNSTHGFRGLANDQRTRSYLANHTGEVHPNLADLAWWYLIRILADPSEVAPIRTPGKP